MQRANWSRTLAVKLQRRNVTPSMILCMSLGILGVSWFFWSDPFLLGLIHKLYLRSYEVKRVTNPGTIASSDGGGSCWTKPTPPSTKAPRKCRQQTGGVIYYSLIHGYLQRLKLLFFFPQQSVYSWTWGNTINCVEMSRKSTIQSLSRW